MVVGDEAAAAAAAVPPGGGLTPTDTGAAQGPAPSVADLMLYLQAQNESIKSMIQMMALDKKQPEKDHLANCKLDEKYFRSVGKFDNNRSSWKEWRRHFLNAIRECDVGWTTVVEVNETSQEPIDIVPLDPTQTQLATNMYNRLIACTSGLAFQIVESVSDYNGLEAWRLLAKQFDPKTDARLTNLVMSIIGHKIKGKNVQAGLITWEGWLLQLQRDHHEDLSEKLKRAFLMNVLPTALQGRVMEHLDRLKTYKEVREKVVSLCNNLEETDIGILEDPSQLLAGGFDSTGEEENQDDWNGWWMDENQGWHAPEPEVDIQGLADMKCYNCGGVGHAARNCPSPPAPGKGGRHWVKGERHWVKGERHWVKGERHWGRA